MSLYDELNSIADVQRLIDDGMREGETIDYKQLRNWIKDESASAVAKHACAFANAAGGLLVFGVSTRKDGDSTLPEKIAGVDPALIHKVERAISDLVRHPIPGVRCKSLGEGPEVFLVDIAPSPLAPHQHSRARVYYRRDGDQSRPMSHDLVELYFGRRLGPVLVPKLDDVRLVNDHRANAMHDYDVVLSVENCGAGSARDFQLVLVDRNQEHCLLEVRDRRNERVEWHERKGDSHEWRLAPGDLVVHPTDAAICAQLRFKAYPHPGCIGVEVAHIRLYAERMMPSEWSIRITVPYPGVRLGLELVRLNSPSADTPSSDD